MSTAKGINWRINRVATGVYYQIGGTVLDAIIDPRVTVHEEEGSESRQLASQKPVEAKPMIEWTMNLRRLDDYITNYAMITAEGSVPAHTLYATDGVESHDLGECKVNTCMININVTESIKAKLQVLIKTHAVPSLGTFLYRTEAAMYKDAVTTLTLGGSAVTHWNQIEFGVDNGAYQEVLGTPIMPAEVDVQAAKYSMRITRALNTSSKFATALAGTAQTFVIALQDNQTVPVTKTFTFANMYLTTSRKEDKALGLVMERIEGKGKSLVIT